MTQQMILSPAPAVPPVQTPNTFAGAYVGHMVDLTLASLLSGTNAVSVGAPGWGKTDVASAIAAGIYGPQALTLSITPSLPPEAIVGPTDIAILLNQSRLVNNIAGSPYDPAYQLLVMDEIGRASELICDQLLFLLERKDVPNPAPVVATTNFMPTSEHTRAMLDRFALWYWVKAGTLDARAVARAQGRSLGAAGQPLTVAQTLPTAQDIADVRAASFTDRAVDAVSDTVELLAGECQKTGYQLNPRRVAQWTRLLLRAGLYHTGSSDFAETPKEAVALLRFAWPTMSEQEFIRWGKVIGNLSDPLAVAIEDVLSAAVGEFNKVAAIADVGARMGETAKLATFLASQQSTLQALGNGKGDPRIPQAITQLTTWFSSAAQGQQVSRD